MAPRSGARTKGGAGRRTEVPAAGSTDAASYCSCFFFQAEDGIRDLTVTGVQTCALPICGMRNRYRSPGVGAPLAARTVPREDVDVEHSLVGRRVRVPATALLRLYDVHDGIVSGRLRGTLEVYTASDAETVAVEGRTVPLEFEETATIAAPLAESPLWKRELWGFLGRAETGDRLPVLASLTPYQRGQTPVVFVHGTASSPGRWADMVNDLL